MFRNIKLYDEGTGDESTLARRSPDNLENENLDAKTDKSGFGEVKTLGSDVPTSSPLDSKTLIMKLVL